MTDMEELALLSLPSEDGQEDTAEGVLEAYHLWAGWSQTHTEIPLGPGKSVKLPFEDQPDPEVVGFAYPLPPVEFAFRNKRRFPPPSEQEMRQEMSRLVEFGLKTEAQLALSTIYGLINQNKRDGPEWQKAFIKLGGVQILTDLGIPFFSHEGSEESSAGENDELLSIRYWLVAIVGRMMGTCEASREALLEAKAEDIILDACKCSDAEVRDCAACGLKGLIQFPEGRQRITYNTLIECLGFKG